MPHSDMSFLSLILNASLLVQLVMLMLLAASVFSWTAIFDRYKTLKEAKEESETFESRFWSGGDLGELYRRLEKDPTLGGQSAIFVAGFKEYARLREHEAEPMAIVEGARRAMRASMGRELDKLENHLSFLATVGSTSPYVGLFGTVWGIMNAFLNIEAKQDPSLAVVAGPIAEALFATGMGLVAAIPAVVYYNKFSGDLNHYADALDSFSQDILVRLSRRASGG